MSQYNIVSATDLYDLCNVINAALSEGWEPLGAPSANGREYIQALCHESDAPTLSILVEDVRHLYAHGFRGEVSCV